jgi:hypothetical protein
VSTRIKVDLDGALPRDMDDKINWAMQTLRWPIVWYSYYRTQNGWHLEIETSKRVHVWRIVALQAILGSDYRRELFNLRRTGNWRRLSAFARERANVLFISKHTFNLQRDLT